MARRRGGQRLRPRRQPPPTPPPRGGRHPVRGARTTPAHVVAEGRLAGRPRRGHQGAHLRGARPPGAASPRATWASCRSRGSRSSRTWPRTRAAASCASRARTASRPRRAGWSTCSWRAGVDPGAFVGALLPAAITGGPPATARWGRGDAFVVEADEYAGNFDAYRPDVAVLLNAEWDHPDVFADEDAVLDAFEGWLRAPGRRRPHPGRERRRSGRRAAAGSAGRLAGPRGPGRPGAGRGGPAHDALDVVGRLTTGGDAGAGRCAGPPCAVRLGLAGRHNAANAVCVAAAAGGAGRRPGRHRGGPGELPGRRSPDGGQGRATGRAGARRLRSSPDGDRGDPRRGPRGVSRPAGLGRLRAADLPPDGRHAGCRSRTCWPPRTGRSSRTSGPGRDPDTTITSAVGARGRHQRSGRRRRPSHPDRSRRPRATWPRQVTAPDVVLVMGGGRSYVIADMLVAALGGAGSRAVPTGRMNRMPNLTPGDGQDLLARFKQAWERRDVDRRDGPVPRGRRVPPRPVRARPGRRAGHPRVLERAWPRRRRTSSSTRSASG